mgnify:CR=1 FL=1|tara:strand:+ start:52 stop:360 length:309 start_codon:yes stop_codon:yes gene_type:complete
MGELANYTIDQVAGALALTLGSVGGLCLILFKSRCQRISICWGVWSCDRKVSEEDQEEDKSKEEVKKDEVKKDEPLLPSPLQATVPSPEPEPEPQPQAVINP